MTEAEWLACDEPDTLLEFVHSRMTARRGRLLAASFCRHVLPLTSDRWPRRAVEIAERFADGLASLEDMLAVSDRVADVYVSVPNPDPVNTEPPMSFKAESIAIQSTRFLTRDGETYLSSCCQCTYLAALRWAALRAGPDEAVPPYGTLVQWQISLIRDVVGNPFRPVPAHPAWLTSTAVSLAQTIYADRAFDRLPILADALEDAGCDSADLLAHLRGDGPHVRGCWALDLVLGKE